MKRTLQAAIAAALVTTSTASFASLQSEMNGLFGSMTNHTPPGYFESARRGVISGGHYVQRNRIMSPNVVSFTPASLEAGCGGIDFYGGSFSFINADQFVQTLRSIAGNAQGYAFQLALKAMSPTIAETMENLQKKIQEFNQHFGNSCQMAQGLVNDTMSAVTGKQNNNASLIGMVKGAGDVFESWGSNSTKSAVESAQDASPATVNKEIKGNVVWRAMKKSVASGWFASGDNSLLEAIMTVTGSIVVGDLGNADDGEGKNFKTTTLSPRKDVNIDALIQGKEVTIYKCQGDTGEDGCLSVTEQKVNLIGFTEMAEQILMDPADGLIQKFSTNSGAPTAQQAAFLAASPAGFGPMVRTLSSNSPELARAFVKQTAPFISLEMAQIVMNDMVDAVRSSMTTSDHAQATEVLKLITEAQNGLDNEVAALQKKYGASLQEMFATYKSFLNVARKSRYWKNTDEYASR